MTKPKSKKDEDDFVIEYEYVPAPDAAECLQEAWEIIAQLILDDYYAELAEKKEEGLITSSPDVQE